jgi:hypothetical protein
MTPDRAVFQTYEPSNGEITVETADGTIHRAAGIGDVIICIADDDTLARIANVLHIPMFQTNLYFVP